MIKKQNFVIYFPLDRECIKQNKVFKMWIVSPAAVLSVLIFYSNIMPYLLYIIYCWQEKCFSSLLYPYAVKWHCDAISCWPLSISWCIVTWTCKNAILFWILPVSLTTKLQMRVFDFFDCIIRTSLRKWVINVSLFATAK